MRAAPLSYGRALGGRVVWAANFRAARATAASAAAKRSRWTAKPVTFTIATRTSHNKKKAKASASRDPIVGSPPFRKAGVPARGRQGAVPSAELEADEALPAPGDLERLGAGPSRADATAVDLEQRHDPADGAGEEGLVGHEEILGPEHRLLGLRLELHDDLAGDSGEDAAASGRRAEAAVLHDEEVARRGLREVALGVEEDG